MVHVRSHAAWERRSARRLRFRVPVCSNKTQYIVVEVPNVKGVPEVPQEQVCSVSQATQANLGQVIMMLDMDTPVHVQSIDGETQTQHIADLLESELNDTMFKHVAAQTEKREEGVEFSTVQDMLKSTAADVAKRYDDKLERVIGQFEEQFALFRKLLKETCDERDRLQETVLTLEQKVEKESCYGRDNVRRPEPANEQWRGDPHVPDSTTQTQGEDQDEDLDTSIVQPGDVCVLQGLVSKPELNGHMVLVQSFHKSKRRFVVRMSDGQCILAKQDNLEFLSDCSKDWFPTEGDWG